MAARPSTSASSATVIRLSRDGVLLAEHTRLTGTGQRHRDPAHYAAALDAPARAPAWSWSASDCARSAPT